MPNTPQQMLLRGQNLLGYKHYSDDVVNKFVECSKKNGVDVFRVFDALNDTRNMHQALQAVIAVEGHAQGTISYTTSPVHTIDLWVDLAKNIQDMGADSLAIKDMAGLLTNTAPKPLKYGLRDESDGTITFHASSLDLAATTQQHHHCNGCSTFTCTCTNNNTYTRTRSWHPGPAHRYDTQD